tara:strand:- start:735 stop:1781 length:1047 start_codon:yes stop_codon:yes gene_type:complete
MKYLVTGGLGFIGSNLSRRLGQDFTNEVHIIDSLTYSGNINSLPELKSKKNIHLHKVSLLEKNKIKKIINDYQPDVIMNLAAESHVDNSINDPNIFIQTNILGTFNLLEASRFYLKKNPNHLFMHISTDEVFGDLGKSKKLFKESSKYDPSSPYSASKASSDHLVRAWGRTYDLKYIITNCSNNYGPYQYPEKLIPHMIISALNGLSLPIYGNGNQIRDWLHVLDHVKGLELISKKGLHNSTYLLGGDNQITNLSIVQDICSLMDSKLKKSIPNGLSSFSELITYVKDRPGHDKTYGVDISTTQKNLGWKPTVPFKTGLRKTIDWYINHQEWWEPLIKNQNKFNKIGK